MITLSELYKSLKENENNNEITITNSMLEGLFVNILSKFTLESITIDKASIKDTSEAITVVGETKIGSFSENIVFQINLICTILDSDNYFEVILSTREDKYTFKSFFGSIPMSRIARGGYYALDESVLNNISINTISIKTNSIVEDSLPLMFEGYIELDNTWHQYRYLINGSSYTDGQFKILSQNDSDYNVEFILYVPLSNSRFNNLSNSKENGLLDNGDYLLSLELKSNEKDEWGSEAENIVSVAKLNMNVLLPPSDKRINLKLPLFVEGYVWQFVGNIDGGMSINDMASFIASLLSLNLGKDQLLLPDGIPVLDDFKLMGFEIDIQKADDTKYVSGLSTLISSDLGWLPDIPFLKLNNISVQWNVLFSPQYDSIMTGGIMGAFTIKCGESNLDIMLSAELPEFNIKGRMIYTDTSAEENVSLDSLVEYFGMKGTGSSDLTVADLKFYSELTKRNFNAEITIKGDWKISLGDVTISFSYLTGNVWYELNEAGFNIEGYVDFDIDGSSFSLILNAGYNNNWNFRGGIFKGTVNITQLLKALFGNYDHNQDSLFQIVLSEFMVGFTIGDSSEINVTAALSTAWKIALLGLSMSLYGKIDFHKDNEQINAAVAVDFKLGSFNIAASVNDILAKNFIFNYKVQYDAIYLNAVYSTMIIDKKPHSILTISMGGTTFGGIVEYLVNLINPNIEYRLSSPWDVLNKIELSKFLLTFDITGKTVTLIYNADLDIIGLAHLETIGLKYDYSGSGKLSYVLTGKMLEKTFGNSNPMEWDAINENPPTVAGLGDSLFKLLYLGVGHHFTSNAIKNAESIETALTALKTSLDASDLQYDLDSNWMLGFEFLLLGSFRMGVILNDPYIYGLLITVQKGEQASLFDDFIGLKIELLYKKITQDIGMFKGLIMLPEKFRKIDVDVFLIILGQVSFEIYTNGNFYIDLGFPHNNNFDNSFSVQAEGFLGRGGIYVGSLSSATTNLVPSITNGTFNTVLALGVGLSFGVGKEFSKSIATGGATLEIFGIFEGILGIFTPYDKSKKIDLYYYARATLGVMGQLYLTVDFKVIRVSAVAKITASITAILEAYKPLELALDLALKLAASVKVFFAKVNFSYEFKYRLEFSLGSKRETPWILASNTSSKKLGKNYHLHTPIRLSHNRSCYSRNLFKKRLLLDKNTLLFNGDKKIIDLHMLPLYSIENAELKENIIKKALDTNYCVAYLLFAETCTTNKDIEAPFASIVDIVARWVLNYTTQENNDDIFTYAEVGELVNKFETEKSTLEKYDSLCKFLNNNVIFNISGMPKENSESLQLDSAIFPLPPALRFKVSSKENSKQVDWGNEYIIDFSKQIVDENYLNILEEYFAAFNPNESIRLLNDDSATSQSLAAYIFTEYFLSIASFIISNVENMYKKFEYYYDGTASLEEISKAYFDVNANKFYYTKQLGDTIAQVALAFSLTVSEFLYLNENIEDALLKAAVGEKIEVIVSTTPESLIRDNPAWKINKKMNLSVEILSYQLLEDDTLNGIKEKFGYKDYSFIDEIKSELRVLREKSKFVISNYSFNKNGLSLEEAKALFFVRYYPDEKIERYEDYATVISELNLDENGDSSIIWSDIPVGSNIKIPIGDILNGYDVGIWKSFAGDTLETIAKYCSLLYGKATTTKFETFSKIFEDLNKVQENNEYIIPETEIIISGDRTISKLFNRIFPDKPEWYEASNPAMKANILSSLTVISLKDAYIKLEIGQTLFDVAKIYGITLEVLVNALKDETSFMEIGNINILNIVWLSKEYILSHLKSEENINTLSSMVSRNFLQGQRIPTMDKINELEDLNFEGLYKVLGQQLSIKGTASDEDFERYKVVVENSQADVSWITFSNATITKNMKSILKTDSTNNIVFIIKDFDILYNMPAKELEVEHSLNKLDSFAILPKSYDLNNAILYQKTGEGSVENIYLLSEDLITDCTNNLDIYSVYFSDKVINGKWSTLLKCKIRRTKNNNSYEVLGLDAKDRLILYQVLNESIDSIQLLYQPSVVQDVPKGLVNNSVNDSETFIVKTNLSIETASGQKSKINSDEESLLYSAPLNDPKSFLKLLWECSVIGGTGYYLNYEVNENTELPLSIFEDNESGELWILINYKDDYKNEHNSLNCVITEDYTYSDDALYISVGEGKIGGVTTKKSTLDIGCEAFGVKVIAPLEDMDISKDDEYKSWMTKKLYSIIGYNISLKGDSAKKKESLPMVPYEPEDDVNTDSGIWEYKEVVPLYKLDGEVSNPYDVLGKSFDIIMSYRDILGNVAVSSNEQFKIELTPLYTNEIIGVNQLPLTSTFFYVDKINDKPMLILKFVPKLENWFSDSDYLDKTDNFINTLDKIIKQWSQDDVNMTIISTLRNNEAYDVKLDKTSVLDYANKLYEWLNLNSYIKQAPRVEATVKDLEDYYTLDLEDIANSNLDISLDELFEKGTNIKIPEYIIFNEGDTIEEYYNNVIWDNENSSLTLQNKTEVKITDCSYGIDESGKNFIEIAEAINCSPEALVEQNSGREGLLLPDFEFTWNGYSIKVDSDDKATIDNICKKFKEEYSIDVKATELALAAEKINFLKGEISILYNTNYAHENETLIKNHFGLTITEFIEKNKDTKNLFVSGSAIKTKTLNNYVIGESKLKDVSRMYSITPREILSLCEELPLLAECKIIIPNRNIVEIPETVSDSMYIDLPDNGGEGYDLSEVLKLSSKYYGGIKSVLLINSSNISIINNGCKIMIDNNIKYETKEADCLQAICRKLEICNIEDLFKFSTSGNKLFKDNIKLIAPINDKEFDYPMQLGNETDGSLNFHFSGAIFEINTAINIERTKYISDEAPDKVKSIMFDIPPYTTTNSDGSISIKEFANLLEASVKDMKIAQGVADTAHLYGVALNYGGINNIEVSPYVVNGIKMPYYYALAPLKNELVSKSDVEIFTIDSEGKIGDSVNMSFIGVDMETWARTFLQDFEQLLKGDFIIKAYKNNPDNIKIIDNIIRAKEKLMNAIPYQLKTIANEITNNSEDIAAAREFVKDRLGVSLVEGYKTGIIAQYSKKTSGNNNVNARLVGAINEQGENGSYIKAGKLFINEDKNFYIQYGTECNKDGIKPTKLEYVINELEYDIKDVPIVNGYQSSKWLQFVNPLKIDEYPSYVNIDLSTDVNVPLPLREYPQTPALINQNSQNDESNSIDGLGSYLNWTYSFRYSHNMAVQDTMNFDIEFNKGNNLNGFNENDKDLFDLLAQYNTVRDTLFVLIKDENKVTIGLATLSNLANDIADYWKSWCDKTENKMLNSSVSTHYRFEVNKEYDYEQRLLILKLIPKENNDISVAAPIITYHSSNDYKKEFTKDDRYNIEINGIVKAYGYSMSFDDINIEDKVFELEMTFKNLSVYNFENANCSIAVTRNKNLFGSKEELTVNDIFIYKTPYVSFFDTVAAFITNSESIIVPYTKSNDPSVEFLNIITEIFEKNLLLNQNEAYVSFDVWYCYGLSTNVKALEMKLPLFMVSKVKYTSIVKEDLVNALNQWYNNAKPSDNKASLRFDITIYSRGENSSNRPIVQLNDLIAEV